LAKQEAAHKRCRKFIEIANGGGVLGVPLVFKFVVENPERKNDPISPLGKW
jgi:hypothetical protein